MNIAAKIPIVTVPVLRRAISKGYESYGPSLTGEIRKVAGSFEEEVRMQGELDEALKILSQEKKDDLVMFAPENQMVSLLQTFIVKQGMQEGKEIVLTETGAYEVKFDEKDWLGWTASFFTWWKRISKHEWISPSATPTTIKNKMKMAVLGDWGSGLYGAPVCAQSIERDPDYDVLLHLGDVYYSGDDNEVRDRFLAFWPKNKNVISRALNSNHEMYTGAKAYFKYTLAQFNQTSSCFALQNDYWVLVGLDSAYSEHDLLPEEVTWLKDIMNGAGDRKIVLFSHHQPISLLEGSGSKLVEKLIEFLSTKKIFAWYWGHEHGCLMYDRHPGWGLFGRCVGHGGFPYFRKKFPGAPPKADNRSWLQLNPSYSLPGAYILDGPNPYIINQEDKYGPHGYISLEFNDGQLNELVHAPDGAILWDKRMI